MATINKFTDLEVWQISNDLEKKVFQLIMESTGANDSALREQINKTVGAIPDNIAKGFGSGGAVEFIQFLSMARASTTELQSQLIRCVNRKHFDQNIYHELFAQTQVLDKKIAAFIQYLNQSDKSGPKFQHSVSPTNPQPATIHTTHAAKPLGAYPHARRVGNLLFLSGIGSRQASDNSIPGLQLDADGNIMQYDVEAECRSVFANVKAVLEASGSSWDKIIDVTVFLTNMKKDFPVYNKIYADYFATVDACRTTVEVKSLPTPICIELKVIAVID